MSHRSSAQKPCNSAMSLTCVARFQPGWVLIVHAPFDGARTSRPCLQATDGRKCRWSSGCARDPTAAAHKPHPTQLGEGRSHGCGDYVSGYIDRRHYLPFLTMSSDFAKCCDRLIMRDVG